MLLMYLQISGMHSRRKFQEKQLSAALGNARPDQLADRVAMLKIETSIASPAGSLMVNTAQVHIRIYRAALSLAESLSGSLFRKKSASSIGLPALNPKLLWQSAQLGAEAAGVIIVDIECAAKAVDAAVEGSVLSSRTHLLQQVLQFLQKKHSVKLTSKSAKVTLKPVLLVHPFVMCHQCVLPSSYVERASSRKRGGNCMNWGKGWGKVPQTAVCCCCQKCVLQTVSLTWHVCCAANCPCI